MKEIIQYFNEVCINELLKVSENLYRDPSKFAEYIEELKETLNKLGVEIIKEITTLGTVSFMKTLYVSKEKNEDGKFEM